jgi:hypothetical protein
MTRVGYGEFQVWQDGMMVAGGSGPMDRVRSEARHYALVYGQDGDVEVRVRLDGEPWPKRRKDR